MLDQSKLEIELRKLVDPGYGSFAGFPADAAAAAANWATAYDVYASDAIDSSGDLVATKNKAGMQSALVFGTLDGNTLATQFALGLIAYWTGATFAVGTPPSPATGNMCPNTGGNFIFSVEQSSVVFSVTTDAFLPALQAEFAIASLDGAAKAASLAAIFHTFTTSGILVLISGLDTTPAPGGPLPITNLCTVR